MKETKRTTYDLEERTLRFAHDVRIFVKKIPRSVANRGDAAQVVRSSGSIGANYIEANEALGKKDFLMRIRIARKEAKETAYWLNLIDIGEDVALEQNARALSQEARELMFILSAIMRKSES